LFVANGLGSILPQTNLDSDFWYQANRYLIDNVRAGDLIITDGGYISELYLMIYTNGEVISARGCADDRLSRGLLHRGFERVWISSWSLGETKLERRGRCPWCSQRVWISSWSLEPLHEVRVTGFLHAADEKVLPLAFQGVCDHMVIRDKGPYQTVWELTQTAG
jgi:hypothetical protein